VAYNAEHGITPTTIATPVRNLMDVPGGEEAAAVSPSRSVAELRAAMHAAAARLDFEEAARLRDEALRIEKEEIGA